MLVLRGPLVCRRGSRAFLGMGSLLIELDSGTFLVFALRKSG